jgi:acetyl-CoA synthetase
MTTPTGAASHDQGVLFPPPPEFAARAHVPSFGDYRDLYESAAEDPEDFWADEARGSLRWRRPFMKVLDWNFAEPKIRWFEDGTLNVSENCLDRHVASGKGDRVAIVWEGDDPKDARRVTYAELLKLVCRFAHVLVRNGVKKGDRVCIYLPMVPEAAAAMLACARIGAVHSVVFGGFSAESLRDRLLDCDARVLITADQGLRGGRAIELKRIADEAVAQAACVERVLVLKRTGAPVAFYDKRDRWLHDELAAPGVTDVFPPVEVGAEDPLFILYTSGSTGKPKGVLHTSGGYLLYASWTHRMVFDWRADDVFWCTADVGWVTGHSYVVYGPLCNGATTVMFEGVPTYPDAGRFWDVVDKHKVTVFYTAPTAIRALEAQGDHHVTKRSRATLRLLGSVGEPINPEAWLWYHRVVGGGKLPIVDTWWQTETGGILISPLPGATPLKPGSATFPLPGVRPCLVDDQGKVLEGNGVAGNLCLTFPWPGMMRTVYGDHERFRKTYFERFPGKYFTGDGCRRDHDGYYWITGRVDDVLNVSGHRIGTAEVESALVEHHDVVEAAVVGMPHAIKGQAIYAYVLLRAGEAEKPDLKAELVALVRRKIGAHAAPEVIHVAPGLPKTRSGKIMRRILRKLAEGQLEDLGDVSTLADPNVVRQLVETRPKS